MSSTEALTNSGFYLRTDSTTRAAYSSDASLFRRVPRAVLEVTSVGDIQRGIALAHRRGWTVTSRGGGTSVAGNAIGHGLVIDTSRHFNRIIDIDPAARTAVVEPGIICDDLRNAAAPYGLTYGPDPSTHSRCTVGGMVANNACGSHSVVWGTAADNIVAVTLMLADGREITIDDNGCSDADIDARLKKFYAENQELIEKELGRFPRQVSGYGLHFLGTNPAHAIAGSEGTLGVITRLKVKLVEKPATKGLVVLAYDTVFDAAADAARLRLDGVHTIEGMGSDLLAALRTQPGRENTTLPGDNADAGGWLFCEVVGDTDEEATAVARRVTETAHAATAHTTTNDAEMRRLWSIRESAAGTATRLPDGFAAWPNWEDSAVPSENLAGYLRDLYALIDRYGYRGIPFGHFDEGCIHVRISFDFSTDAGVGAFRSFMRDAARLVASYGGSLSGEHGDGRARSALLGEMYSPVMLDLFAQFKRIFDPTHFFNPGVLVEPDKVTDGLRMDPQQRQLDIREAHSFSNDPDGLLGGINRCVGVGACRSLEGAMCPSYQVTGDEVHTTRGRARVLSEMFRGESVDSSDAVEALDLCLSCKACASECPVNVDMATYKAEVYHHHFRGRLRPLAHYTMGWLPLFGHLVHKLPGVPALVDAALQNRFTAAILRRAGGLADRPLIRFAHRSLRKKFSRSAPEQQSGAASTQRVVFWPDTFNTNLDTAPATAAIDVLERVGFEVVIPQKFVCCGLTWHSTGQLDMAKRVIEHSARVMKPYLDQKLPVIGLEPSCTVMLGQGMTELSDDPDVRRLSEATESWANFIAPHLSKLDIPRQNLTTLTQVHCHERSVGDPSGSQNIVEALGIDNDDIETGCCGLAGNWGFEKGHADVSFELGERELFPRVRDMDKSGEAIADGYSCRTHIAQGTGTRAKHLAEVVRDVLDEANIH